MRGISCFTKGNLSRVLPAVALLAAPLGAVPARAARQACVSASQILQFANSLGAKDLRDAYPVAAKLAFGNRAGEMAAFEENRTVVYAAGDAPWPGGGGASRPTRLLRRWIVLKPSIFILDDELSGPPGAAPPCLVSSAKPQIAGHGFRIRESNGSLQAKILLPQGARLRVQRLAGGDSQAPNYRIEWTPREPRADARFLCVLNAAGQANFRAEAGRPQGREELTVTASGGKLFHLKLPPLNQSAGTIAISSPQGEPLLTERPFPSGILPHGPKGSRLLEAWDRDYQGKKPPAWDIHVPAAELQKAVQTGRIHACRAVDICCGSGTDAVYLAQHGFQMTAIDIAPTALSEALRKGRAAQVKVNWLLADVLALPKLQPFDFIYDRGCYHVVRDQNLDAYLETLRRLSHPGTEMLLLAARRDRQQGSGSVMGVTEDELRFDFTPLFTIQKLQAIRLQSNEPGPGPPGWAVLMRRKGKP